MGYRDAMIVKDSVSQYDEKTVNVYLNIDEGQKYYLRNVTWVGNTLYPSEQLNFLLRMKKGDVYNQKLLNERVSTDDDAIGNLYYNNGYLFYNLDPVEVNIVGDSMKAVRLLSIRSRSVVMTVCMKTSFAVNFVFVRDNCSAKKT